MNGFVKELWICDCKWWLCSFSCFCQVTSTWLFWRSPVSRKWQHWWRFVAPLPLLMIAIWRLRWLQDLQNLQWLPNASKGTHPAKLLQSGPSVPASLLFATRLTSLGFDNERIHCVPAQFSRTPACCPLEAIMILPSLSPGHSKLPRGQRSLHPAAKREKS